MLILMCGKSLRHVLVCEKLWRGAFTQQGYVQQHGSFRGFAAILDFFLALHSVFSPHHYVPAPPPLEATIGVGATVNSRTGQNKYLKVRHMTTHRAARLNTDVVLPCAEKVGRGSLPSVV